MHLAWFQEGLNADTNRGPQAWFVGLVSIVICASLGVAAATGLIPGLAAQESQVARVSIAAVAGLVVLAIVLNAIFGDAYAGALWLTGPRVPGIAALAIVIAYLVPADRNGLVAVTAGTLAAALAWLLISVAFRYLARADSAHSRPYGELIERIDDLTDRANGLNAHKTEIDEINRQLTRARDLLHEPQPAANRDTRGVEVRPVPRAGKQWAAGTAYFVVWRAVHAAEEALLEFGTNDMAIGEALHDDLRLANSTIDNTTVLRRSIRNAVVEIDPEAIERYFPNLEGVPDAKPRAVRRSGPARATLREIRHAINEFRDTARDSLAQSRNRLLSTILVAGLVSYILLATAILNGIDPQILESAVAFFLVGAIVGLFNRLRIEASANRAIDDFGLFEARLLHTPLISGLAGVGGVFLVAIAPLASGVMGSSSGPGLPEMAKVFDVSHNQVGLLVAALFGLTPSSIIGSLQKQTDRLKLDLSASSPVSADGQGSGANN